MTLQIKASHLASIGQHGETTYPRECCGVLTGELLQNDTKKVLTVVSCRNVHQGPTQSWYQIDPRELVRIQREAYGRGEEVIGFYHSHPDDDARWSPSDLAEAHWTGCSYLIIEIDRGRASRTNSFELVGNEDSKRFEDEEVVVEDDMDQRFRPVNP